MKADFDARELRNVFGLFATGVAVVTGVDPRGAPVGLTVNSMTSVSLDPPLLLWCLASKSANLPSFELGAPFHVHILAQDQTSLALHFARSGREKFEVDPAWAREPAPPHVEGAIAKMACKVDALHPAGDHVVIIGRIEAAARAGGDALVFHAGRFGRFQSQVPVADFYPGSSDGWL